MSKSITVATANTHESRMLHDPQGLVPFTHNEVDVILMQEVLGFGDAHLQTRLARDGYNLGHFDGTTGLAIAVSQVTAFQPESGTERTEIIQSAEKVSDLARRFGINIGQRLRPRGLVAVKLNDGEDWLTVASTHPIIFVRALARAKQLKEIGRVLQTPYYQNDALVIGADMNHYPGPRKVDIALRSAAGLKAAEVGQPTWRVEGSRHEWAAKIGTRILRKELDDFDGELDVILYKGLVESRCTVLEIASDHDAIVATFSSQC